MFICKSILGSWSSVLCIYVFMYLYIPEFVFKFVLETVELLPTERRLILRVSNKFRDDEDDIDGCSHDIGLNHF